MNKYNNNKIGDSIDSTNYWGDYVKKDYTSKNTKYLLRLIMDKYGITQSDISDLSPDQLKSKIRESVIDEIIK